MVTMNISTDADLANGTRGVVTNIILDHEEQLEESKIDEGIVTLAYPPAMITFKLIKLFFPKFDGLQQGEILLFPSEYNFHYWPEGCNQSATVHTDWGLCIYFTGTNSRSHHV